VINTSIADSINIHGLQVPIIRPAHWQNVPVVPGYTVSFQKISDHILLTTPIGVTSVDAIETVYKFRKQFLSEFFAPNEFFLEVKDYRSIPGLPASDVRTRQAELFLQDAIHCRGIYACGLSNLLRSMLHVALLLHKSPYPFILCSSLEDALSQAMQQEHLQAILVQDFQHAILASTIVEALDFGEFGVRIWVREPNIMGIDVRGKLREEYLDAFRDIQRKVLSGNAIDKRRYYRIFDATEVTNSDWSMRRKLAAHLKRILDEFGKPRLSIVVGANRMTRVGLSLALWFSRGFLRFVDTPAQALALVEADCKNLAPLTSDFPNNSTKGMEADLIRLMEDIGQLSWRGADISFQHITPEHRLRPIYDALELVHVDFLHLLETRERDTAQIAQAHAAMESALKARAEFLQIANHEIRTPLNGLVGMLDLARQNNLDEETRDYLDTAKDCTDNLMTLMVNLLDLSSIESGRLQVEAAPFIPRDLLQDLDKKHRSIIEVHGIEFITKYSGDLGCELFGDGQRLIQILNVLLQNAAKFTSHGIITLECTAIPDEHNIKLQCAVQDSGTGIQASELQKIFEPFQQADSTFARRYGGIGLGLAIVDQLIRMLGATISVQSELGKGSRFLVEVSFPVAMKK